MIVDIILICVGLLGVIIAAISDIKTREVPNIVSYGLIFAGFCLRLIHSVVTHEWGYFLWGAVSFLVIFIVGNILYRTAQWGGGDTKLLMGVGIIFATTPFYLKEGIFPFIIIIIFNIAVFGAFYGLVYGIIIGLKNKKKFVAALKINYKEKKFLWEKISAISFAIIILSVSYIFIADASQKLLLSVMSALLLIFPYMLVLMRSVEKGCMYKQIPVKKLTEGDWVEENVIINKKIIYKKKKEGIEKSDITKLIEAKVQSVLVKEGIPFVPPFLMGIAYSLIFGQIIFMP